MIIYVNEGIVATFSYATRDLGQLLSQPSEFELVLTEDKRRAG